MSEDIGWFEKIDFRLLALVLFIAYVNDTFLLPFFIKKKQFAIYTLVIISIIVLSTTIFCYHIVDCMCSYTVCLSQQLWKFLIPVVCLSLIWILLRLSEKQKEIEKIDKERLNIELKFLKSQINPHVLFNNLNTVYAQAIKGSDNVADMILMLSENLKYILYQSEENQVPLEKDIDFIDNYLQFQKLRTQGINNIEFHIDIDSYNHTIAPLLLISLIENAFKHSSYKEDDLSDIIINLDVKNGQLHFSCENEVDEESGKRDTEGFQIGLKNLQKRLDLIYPDRHSFTIEKKENSFVADLNISL